MIAPDEPLPQLNPAEVLQFSRAMLTPAVQKYLQAYIHLIEQSQSRLRTPASVTDESARIFVQEYKTLADQKVWLQQLQEIIVLAHKTQLEDSQ